MSKSYKPRHIRKLIRKAKLERENAIAYCDEHHKSWRGYKSSVTILETKMARANEAQRKYHRVSTEKIHYKTWSNL